MTRNNEGYLDRIVRICVGILILSLVFVGPKSPLGLLGLIPILTGVWGFCPLYRLFGINTRHRPAA